MGSLFQHDLQRLSELLQSCIDSTSIKELRGSTPFLRLTLEQFIHTHRAELSCALSIEELLNRHQVFNHELLQRCLEMVAKDRREAQVPVAASEHVAGVYQISAKNWHRLKHGLQSVMRRTRDPELMSLISEGGALDEKLSNIVEQSLMARTQSALIQWHGRDIAVGCEYAPIVLQMLHHTWNIIFEQQEIAIAAGDIHLVVLDHAQNKTVDIYVKDFPWSHFISQFSEFNGNVHGVNLYLHQWRGRPLLRLSIPGNFGREKMFTFSVCKSLYAFSLHEQPQIQVVSYLGNGVIECHNGETRHQIKAWELGTSDGQWYPVRGKEISGMAIWSKGQDVFLIDDAHGVTWAAKEAAPDGRYIACTADGRRMPLVQLTSLATKKIA